MAELQLVDLIANLETAQFVRNTDDRGEERRGYFISEEEMLNTKRNLRLLLQQNAQRGNIRHV